ncbi:MAG: CPBP family intramembrane glutamic endopeptidase [Gemmatimonadaceae bacterium]
MTARDLFVGADGRPRWGWRLVIFVVAAAVAFSLLGALVAGLASLLFALTAERLLGLGEWALTLSLLAATAFTLGVVDRRGWDHVFMGRGAGRPGRLALGFLLGALAIGVPSGLLLAARWLRVEPWVQGSWSGAAWSLAVTLAPAAFWEELMFRGYPFAVLRERFGPRLALGVTSLVFGVVHAQNPGAAPLPVLMVVVAGVFLGGVMLATRSLYAAWGAHFAWNWTMAAIFHMAVSGAGFPTPNYRVVEVGPDWLTGGSWGTEGGIGALLGMSAGLWYLFARPGRRQAALARDAGDTGNTLARPSGREESRG